MPADDREILANSGEFRGGLGMGVGDRPEIERILTGIMNSRIVSTVVRNEISHG
jgi:hypothetical protein